jgi:mono/diheme cytochrome c family protein
MLPATGPRASGKSPEEPDMLAEHERSLTGALRSWLRKHHPWPLWAFLLIIAALVILARAAAAESAARAKILAEGKQEYEENCVACHGADGKGGGELAASLVKPPRDLTAIASANGGVFPFWHTFDAISGDKPVPGHDTHQMPDFYARMKSQDFKPGYLPSHVRILELTHFLESLQGK